MGRTDGRTACNTNADHLRGLHNTIRYDTIAEFNVDSKAEYKSLYLGNGSSGDTITIKR